MSDATAIANNVTGEVKMYNDKRGFGFIKQDITEIKVFFHKTEVSYKNIEAGHKVKFDLYLGPKGHFAESVESLFSTGPGYSESEPESEAEEHFMEESATGVVRNYDDKRGFGFIRVNDTYRKVFFHKTVVSYQDIEAGDEVTFDLNHGPKGYFAESVRLVEKYSDLGERRSDYDSDEHVDPKVNLGTDVTGVVEQYLDKFGFITANDTDNKVFFHISNVFYQPVEVGNKVRFVLYQGPKGYFAESVRLLKEPSDYWEDEDIQSQYYHDYAD